MPFRLITLMLIGISARLVDNRALRAQSPATELITALDDAEQLHAHDRATTRYLSLYAIPPDRRGEVAAVAGYTLNALSRSRAIVLPKRITDTLLRLQYRPLHHEQDRSRRMARRLGKDRRDRSLLAHKD